MALIETEHRRSSGIRRDLNDLVRSPDGKISGSKIGTYAGQYIAGNLLLTHADDLIDHWDSLAIMFTVLIAPEMWRMIMSMKYGGTTTTSESASSSRTVTTP